MADAEILLRQAANEIRNLRRANEVLAAQAAVVETFRAALLGRPSGGIMAPCISWEIDRYLERAAKKEPVG
jgi:hypothetical protein